jgi:RHS repeat-associated protein
LTGIGGTVLYDAQYTYDVFDRRIGVLEDADGAGLNPAVQSWTLYDGDNAWADFNGSGTLTMRYLNGTGMDQRFARVDGSGNVGWYLTDNLGSVRQVVQTDGTVLDAISYTAFGQIASESSAGNGDRFKYTGREWDAGTGQYYYRARYYGAGAGRFTSQDPLKFAAGDTNLSRYVANNTTIGTDPSGQSWRTWVGVALFVAIVVVVVVIAAPYVAPLVVGAAARIGAAATAGGAAATKLTPSQSETMRNFFQGNVIPNTPENVAAMQKYLLVAQKALADYAASGYTGPGVQTQTLRIQQILAQLNNTGLGE